MGLYGDTAPRGPLEQRVVTGFPLPAANMTAPVVETDIETGKQWPPRRVETRHQRLRAYHKLFDGDFSNHVFDPMSRRIVSNYCERIPSAITALLMTSDPMVPEQDLPAVRQLLSDAALNAMVYGRAYMTRFGDAMESPQTVDVFDLPNSAGIIQAITGTTGNSEDGIPDIITFYAYGPEAAIAQQWAWNESQIGDFQGESSVAPGTFTYVDRPPVRNMWGRSMLDLIGPLACEIAVRLTGTDRTLAQNEHPLLVVPMAMVDAGEASNVQLPNLTDPSDKPSIIRDLKRIRDHDVAWIPEGISNPEYVEWGGEAMTQSFTMIDQLLEEISALTGLPRALSSGMQEVASGVALRRMLVMLWATTKQLHNSLHSAAQEVYGSTFEWPNPFEEEEEQEPDAMDDEEEADAEPDA